MLRSRMFSALLVSASLLHAACSRAPTDAQVLQSAPLEIKSFALIDEEIGRTISDEMQKKCVVLFARDDAKKSQCQAASEKLAQHLNFNYIKRSDGQSAFVFMAKKLKELLEQPATLTFLAELQTAAEDALYLNKPLNVWAFALEKSQGRTDIATERLAVLIQDGAETAAQVKYLLIAQHPAALQLAQAVSVLEEALKRGKAQAYPSHLQSNRTALYHYYVPRYLAQKLIASKVRADMAALLPFMFNSSYELHQIQKSENPNLPLNHRRVSPDESASPQVRRLVEKWNSYDTLYSDLLDHLGAPFMPFDPLRQKENLDDLYLGYVAGLDGAFARGEHLTKLMNLGDFSRAFAADPAQFLTRKPPQ